MKGIEKVIIEQDGGFKITVSHHNTCTFITQEYEDGSGEKEVVDVVAKYRSSVAKAIAPELETKIKAQEFEIKRLTKVYIAAVNKYHEVKKEKEALAQNNVNLWEANIALADENNKLKKIN